MKVTWRAAISGHEATFSQTSGFLDPVAPKMCWVLATGVITICTQSGVLSKRAEAGLALAHPPPGSKREARPLSLLRPLLSFPASPPGSLTSLIYGEQSEKTSPSDISLEMEHKDKVSAGWARAGRGWAVLAPGSSAAGAGRDTLTVRALQSARPNLIQQCGRGHTPQPCQPSVSRNTERVTIPIS